MNINSSIPKKRQPVYLMKADPAVIDIVSGVPLQTASKQRRSVFSRH